MNPVRLGIFGAAGLAALVLALLVRGLASSHERPRPVVVAAPGPAMARVLVARRDLQPGDRLGLDDLNWQPWPAAALNPAYVTDGAAVRSGGQPAAVALADGAVQKARDAVAGANGPMARFIGAIVREPMETGEPVVEQKVVRAGQAGALAVTLDPGARAMSVPLAAESAAGGFILPGDHVDVVQSRQTDGPTHRYVAGTVLTNVRVLAVDQSTRAVKNIAVIGRTATLEVTPAQAELLTLAKAQGELTLILRSYADAAGPAVAGAGPRMAMGGSTGIVRVYRNGGSSDVAVSR